jgi:dephospho-CoA kinase
MARNNLSEEDAVRRIKAQMTNEERISRADRVIWNNGTAEDLEQEVCLSVYIL